MENVKKEKADELVFLLDLFQGQLSLNDLLNREIPLIEALKNAKIRRNDKIAKEKEKLHAEIAKNKDNKNN